MILDPDGPWVGLCSCFLSLLHPDLCLGTITSTENALIKRILPLRRQTLFVALKCFVDAPRADCLKNVWHRSITYLNKAEMPARRAGRSLSWVAMLFVLLAALGKPAMALSELNGGQYLSESVGSCRIGVRSTLVGGYVRIGDSLNNFPGGYFYGTRTGGVAPGYTAITISLLENTCGLSSVRNLVPSTPPLILQPQLGMGSNSSS